MFSSCRLQYTARKRTTTTDTLRGPLADVFWHVKPHRVKVLTLHQATDSAGTRIQSGISRMSDQSNAKQSQWQSQQAKQIRREQIDCPKKSPTVGCACDHKIRRAHLPLHSAVKVVSRVLLTQGVRVRVTVDAAKEALRIANSHTATRGGLHTLRGAASVAPQHTSTKAEHSPSWSSGNTPRTEREHKDSTCE